MNALFMGGNSQRHAEWIHHMAAALDKPYGTAVVHDYRHWQTGEQWADIDYEITQVTKKMADLRPYVVFAKSIGTMIALKAMYDGLLKPEACLFLGLPLNATTDMGLPADEWLAASKVPLYFMHNEHDPYGSVEELRAMLPANIDQSNITVLSGDTHDYNDVTVMRELLARASS